MDLFINNINYNEYNEELKYDLDFDLDYHSNDELDIIKEELREFEFIKNQNNICKNIVIAKKIYYELFNKFKNNKDYKIIICSLLPKFDFILKTLDELPIDFHNSNIIYMLWKGTIDEDKRMLLDIYEDEIKKDNNKKTTTKL